MLTALHREKGQQRRATASLGRDASGTAATTPPRRSRTASPRRPPPHHAAATDQEIDQPLVPRAATPTISSDELRERYVKHFKGVSRIPTVCESRQSVPLTPTLVETLPRDDPEAVYYFRPPEAGDGPFTTVQDGFSRGGKATFSAWARYNFMLDAAQPRYAASDVLSHAHLTQLSSMTIKRNSQNIAAVAKAEAELGGPVDVSEYRYQPDLHPVLLEMIAEQDGQRYRDLKAAPLNKLPQVHCAELADDVLEMGSFEPDKPLLSLFGYIQPEEGYEGMEARVDDATWVSTTPLAIQHAASLANCAMTQNSALQYLTDSIMVQFDTRQRALVNNIDPLHVYFAGVVRSMQRILKQQAAQLSTAAQHSKYMLRDSLTRCCTDEVRRNILSQPLLQDDRLWEPVANSQVPPTFEELMIRENLRPAPSTIRREIEREDRQTFGLASPESYWVENKVVKEAHERLLKRQRNYFATKQRAGTLDPDMDFDPDARCYARFPADERSMEEVLESVQHEVFDEVAAAREAAQEKADLDFLVTADATEEEMGSSDEFDSDQEREEAGGASVRRGRLAVHVAPKEVERLLKDAGPTYEALPETCPEAITIQEVFENLKIPVGQQARYVDFAREQVVLREAEIADWHASQRQLQETAPDPSTRTRAFTKRRAKWSIPKMRRKLLPPATRADYDRLQLGMRNYTRSVAPLVPQDEAMIHTRTKTKVVAPTRKTLVADPSDKLAVLEARKARRRLTDKRRRRVKSLMKKTGCTMEEAKEQVQQQELQEEMERLEAKEKAELEEAAAALAAQAEEPAPTAPTTFEELVPAQQPSTSGTTASQAGPSVKRKHRHEDSPEEELSVHPDFFRTQRLAREEATDLEETSPEVFESYDEYEEEGGRRKKVLKKRQRKRKVPEYTSEESSQDDASPDRSLQEGDLKQPSGDSTMDEEVDAQQAGPADPVPAAEEDKAVAGTKQKKRAPRKANKPPAAKKPRAAPARKSSRAKKG